MQSSFPISDKEIGNFYSKTEERGKMNIFGKLKQPVWIAVTALLWLATVTSSLAGALNIRIIHMNDIHSHLSSQQASLYFDGVKTYVEMGGMPRAVTKIRSLAQEQPNHLILNAGDTIQGTLFYTLFKGEATAAMLNLIPWDAMVLGNHEFDDGDQALSAYIQRLTAPIVAANVIPQEGNILRDKWTPYIIKEIAGERVGIIGIDVKQKTQESSCPSDEITFLDEIATAQQYANELASLGVDKIVLLSHFGLANDIRLAQQVSGIDIIIGGDSHTLMGDLSEVGLSSSNPYPVTVNSPSGQPVCIAQAWDYAKMVGSLDASFDENGIVTSCTGRSILLLGDSFRQKDAEGQKVQVDPETRNQIIDIINSMPNVGIVPEDEDALETLSQYQDQVDDLKQQVIGEAREDLNHVRIPGQDYLGNNGADFPLGSEIAPLVAKSFYEQARRADCCIQNAGGVRINVPAGDITIETAYTLLPFANTLYEIEMKGEEIKQVLEDAINNFYDFGGSTGSFPYAYGLRYDINMAAPMNSRISNLEILDRETGSWSMIDPEKIYVVVTNSYIAAGRDGYRTFKTVQDMRGPGTDTYLDYAMSFVNYVKSLAEQGLPLAPLPPAEHCIKSFIQGDDFRVLPYLQNPAPNAMTVLWLSNDSQPGTIEVEGVGTFTSTPKLAAALAYHPDEINNHFGGVDPGTPYIHRIRVTGLEPGTTYSYTVHQGRSIAQGTLKTAPGKGSSVKFVVYADSETEPESTGKTRRNSEPFGNFDRHYWIDQTDGYFINLKSIQEAAPDFIAIAGDIVESGNEQRDWDEFWKHNAGRYNDLAKNIPILPALGNHENHSGRDGGGGFYTTPLAKDAVARYRTYFETPDNGSGKEELQDRFYRVDYGPVTLITIDSSNGKPNRSNQDTNWYLLGEGESSDDHPEWGEGEAPDFNPGSPMYQWIEEQLADARKKSRFIFVQFHHAPYSVGPHGFNPGDGGQANGEDTQSGVPMRILTPLFKKYGVDAVFSGHDEMYEHSVIEGIHFYDIGIGGDGLRGPYMGEDGKYPFESNNPYQVFLAHLDAPEEWNGPQLVDGGKHYGHLEIEVKKSGNEWQATIKPVYVFPLMDQEGDVIRDLTGKPVFEPRIYRDEVVLTRSPGDLNRDGILDRHDLQMIRQNLRKNADECPVCDIDGDGRITIMDARKLVLMIRSAEAR